jgi:hypothetical protein
MSDGVEFKATLDVTGASEEAVTQFAISHLRERGYYCAKPDAAWERNGAFCKRVGLWPHRIQEVIDRYQQRGGPPINLDRRGQSGRLVSLQSNPSFDAFCRSQTRAPRNPL